ncbi:MAG: peptidylprolyl isomerase [Chitinophagaceae bacterium]|nr:peptidylprolyl isomerase [Chitinophagaceae bacterium]
MRKFLLFFILSGLALTSKGQSVAEIKKILDTTSNPIGFVKYVLKKKYYIDTVTVLSTVQFLGKADSLAYHGKVGKTYGPFKKENILVKVLTKAPNTFYHVNHILLDRAIFDSGFAESLADTIIAKIKAGTSSFAAQASLYSADLASASQGGDLGWFIKGVMLPQLDRELTKRKKGELFKVWSESGLHIVRIADNPKEDTGYALLLRVIL